MACDVTVQEMWGIGKGDMISFNYFIYFVGDQPFESVL